MSRTKAFALNTISTALLQIVTAIVGFILPRVMLKVYGSEINGLVSSILQFISYFNLLEAGLSGATTFALYKPIADKDHDKMDAILSTAKSFFSKIGGGFFLLLLLLAFIYPYFVESESLVANEISALVLALGLKGVLEFFVMAKYRVLLTADQKVSVVSIISSITIVLNTVIVVVLALQKLPVYVTYFAAVTSILLRSLILTLYVKRNYPYISFKKPSNKDLMHQRWDVLYLQVLGLIQQGIPIVVLTVFASLETVSVYAVYNMVILGLYSLLSIFTRGLGASFGDVIAKNEIQTLQKTASEFEVLYNLVLTWASISLVLLLKPFIAVYTHGVEDTNYDQPLFAMLLSANFALNLVKTPQGMLVMSAGLYKETRIQTTIQGLIALIGCFVGGYFWGLVGVVSGLILSNIYRIIDLNVFIPRNVTKLPIHKSFFRLIRLVVLLLVAIQLASVYSFEPTSITDWLIKAAVITIIVGIITVFSSYLFEKETILSISRRLKKLLKGKL